MLFREKGALLVDLQGRIAFSSSYLCELFGAKQDEILGKSCFDFFFPEDLAAAKKLFEVNGRSPRVAPHRLRVRRPDGSGVWADIKVAPLQAASGEIYGVAATITGAPKSEG